jgi:hypothetical protein
LQSWFVDAVFHLHAVAAVAAGAVGAAGVPAVLVVFHCSDSDSKL